MKKILLSLVLAPLAFGAANDVKIVQKNSANTAWRDVVVTPTGNTTIVFDASLVPTITGTTGTGNVVRATSPTLETPALGAASATTLVATGNVTAAGVRIWNGLAGDAGTTSIGASAGNATTSGVDNTFVGVAAGWQNTTGSMNVAIGRDAGSRITVGSNNTFTGYQNGLRVTSGTHNSGTGKYAFSDTTTGVGNTGMGYAAGVRNVTGTFNSHFGYEAGHDNQTGDFNTGVGFRALVTAVATGGSISAFADAGGGNVTVTSSAHGRTNGNSIKIAGTTSYNGTYTVANATTNTFTIVAAWVADDATGWWRLNNSEANENTAVGANAGKAITTGYRNTFLGAEAGNVGQIATINTATAIGYGAVAGASNEIALGTAAETVKIYGGRVAFPATQSASGDANTLDDYEEGTATVAVVTGGGTVTLSTNTLAYTKVGRQVTVTGKLVVGSVSSPTGNFVLTGLPFTVATGNQFAAPVTIMAHLLTTGATTSMVGFVSPGTTNLNVYTYSAGSVGGSAATFQASSELFIGVTYFTN